LTNTDTQTNFREELKQAARDYANALFDYSFSIEKQSPRDLVNNLDDIRMNEWQRLEKLIERAVDEPRHQYKKYCSKTE